MFTSNECRTMQRVPVAFTRFGRKQFTRLNRALGARFIRAFVLQYELAAYLAEHEANGVQLDTECQEVRYEDGVYLLLRKMQGVWYIIDPLWRRRRSPTNRCTSGSASGAAQSTCWPIS